MGDFRTFEQRLSDVEATIYRISEIVQEMLDYLEEVEHETSVR